MTARKGHQSGMPVCCTRCFRTKNVRAFIRSNGTRGRCDYCGAKDVITLDPILVAEVIRPVVEEYQKVEAGVHFIPQMQDASDVGRPLEELIDEDYPDLFSAKLDASGRESLMEALVDGLNRHYDFENPRYGLSGDLWTRPGNELWADAEDDEERFFPQRPRWWAEFVQDIRQRRRFVREGPSDPARYLTPDLLKQLAKDLPVGFILHRAVPGGERSADGVLHPHGPDRMRGPLPEHTRRGGRVNPPGIPMLYAARGVETVIAEVRPFKGAPVSVAAMAVTRPLRIIDFSANRRTPNELGVEVTEVLDAIGREMARPIDPDASETEYVPTQYVAELVRAAGYDGVAFESSLGPGTNFVLFDRNDAEVRLVELYQVHDVSYEFEQHPDTID